MFDLLRASNSCSRWRDIVQSSSPLQKRLWLKPEKKMLPKRKPRKKPDHMTINIVIRKHPATIWNDSQQNLWELTWHQDDESETIPGPRNPIVTSLEDFLQIFNPNFIYQSPYTGCAVQTPTSAPRSLVFSSLDDLDKKTSITETKEESWQKMLVSQHCITREKIVLESTVRQGARATSVGNMPRQRRRRDGRDLNMGYLISSMQKSLRALLWRLHRFSSFVEDLCEGSEDVEMLDIEGDVEVKK